jgi:UDP-N-acetylbacillosamine N-acetyltransferase
MKRLLILGAGGYGRTVAELAEEQFDEIAFLDDNATLNFLEQTEHNTVKQSDFTGEGAKAADWPVLGTCETYTAWREAYPWAYPAFGNNALRAAWMEKLRQAGFAVPTLVHPRAWVSRSACIESGAVVLALAAVGAHARVGEGAIVNVGAIADHDSRIGRCAHLAPGAIVKAGAWVNDEIKIESGQLVAGVAPMCESGGKHE